MLNLFEHLIFWHWLLFAAVLLILELLTGSGFLFWIGMSAAIISCLVWLFPDMSWIAQLLGFSILGMLTAILWWLYLKRNPIATDRPLLNKRSEQYIGRTFTLDAPVINGLGKLLKILRDFTADYSCDRYLNARYFYTRLCYPVKSCGYCLCTHFPIRIHPKAGHKFKINLKFSGLSI